MATLRLTRNETGTLLKMREPGYFEALNEAVGETECDAYQVAATWYVGMEGQVLDADETIGIDENGHDVPIAEFPSHPNPLITRPRFDD